MWSNALRHLRSSRARQGMVADRRHQRGPGVRMSKPRDIPPAVTERQTAASDPGSSAWVAANAGSGKTHVLAQRVIRLLLSGVDPARILCITFTKAAAANMANRVFNDLRAWTVLDDAALDDAMRRAGEKRIDAKRRLRARQLFALALETPGGLKVQTIHAFCTQLLHQFPFEANVAARFEVLDEAQENQLLEQLSLDVMLKAAGEPDSAARPGAGPGRAGRRRRDVPRPGARGDPAARQADALGRGRRRRAAGDGAALARARHRRRTRRWQQVEAADFRRQPDRVVRMGRGRRCADGRDEDRQGPGRPLPRAGHAERRRAARHLSGYFLHQRASQGPRQDRHRRDPARPSEPVPAARPGARPRLGAGAAQARASRRATAASRCSPSPMP